MQIIKYADVILRERQRKKVSPPGVNELKESILSIGLIHPPLVYPLPEGKYLLLAGERRYTAVGKIHEEKKYFQCDAKTIDTGELPVTLTELSNLLDHKQIELDENIQREDLTWQEKAEALAEIYKLKMAANPSITFKDVGAEVVAKQGSGSPKHMATKIRESVVIAEHLHKPAVAKARNAAEAHNIILREQENIINAEIARRAQAKLVSPDIFIRQGDLFEVLPVMEPDVFDLILADPPYGIGASDGGFRARTEVHHNYEDDEESSWKIQKAILIEGFRLAKQRANLLMFTDIKWWDRLQRVSAQVGWTPFRRPMLWGKSDSEGLAPWGAAGPRITTDFIFFATKGQKGLVASPIDYIRANRVPRHERVHAAEKPVELIRKLLECSTLPGDKVLDPCCGSGSTLIAAKELQRRAVGIEKDQTYYELAMSNVYGEKK